MKYLFEKNKISYEHLSSGKILYNSAGLTAFPVRLANEIIQRCFNILEFKGNNGPYIIYDPCCGGGYLLTSIGFLHGERIKKIIASDIDIKALDIAKKNLSLLHVEGLNKRIGELKSLAQTYNKPSHWEAIASAIKLYDLVDSNNHISIDCFKADILNVNKHSFKADIIFTDFPYGLLTKWSANEGDVLSYFLTNISKCMKSNSSLLAIVYDKKLKINNPGFQRIKHFKIGKRYINIFTLN
jgi:23S rRNA (guanine2535-N1)-methyltransferase